MTSSDLARAQEQPIEALVFSGGGAKGAIYPGTFQAIVEANVLDDVKVVAGSSAGSITAALIAGGMEVDECIKISEETNMANMLGDGFVINKDGKPIYDLVNINLKKSILSYLDNNNIMAITKTKLDEVQKEQDWLKENKDTMPAEEFNNRMEQNIKSEAQLKIFHQTGGSYFEKLRRRCNAEDSSICFRDLSHLRLLAPERFKDLVVTATDRQTRELVTFDADHTPDVDVALACRASSSLPKILHPVKINGREFVDGGVINNIPISEVERHMDEKRPENERNQPNGTRILAFAFGNDMNADPNVAIFTAQENITSHHALKAFAIKTIKLCSYALQKGINLLQCYRAVGGKISIRSIVAIKVLELMEHGLKWAEAYIESEEKVHQKLRENALNVVVLSTGDVGILSFAKAQEKSKYLRIKGLLQTTEHFNNHNLNKNQDRLFDHKNVALSLYEQLSVKKTNEESLLDCCDSNKKWKSPTSKDNAMEDVLTAAQKHNGGPETLASVLNNPFTAKAVQQEYRKLLGVEEGQKFTADNINKYKVKEAPGLELPNLRGILKPEKEPEKKQQHSQDNSQTAFSAAKKEAKKVKEGHHAAAKKVHARAMKQTKGKNKR